LYHHGQAAIVLICILTSFLFLRGKLYGKILTISTAAEVEVKHPKAKHISLEPMLLAWQEDDEALEDLNAGASS
jgi:hypothetical protein